MGTTRRIEWNRIFGLWLVALASSILFSFLLGEPEARQPVPFPHVKHAELNMSCGSCHTGAFEGTHAGIPSVQSCALCHKADRTFPPTPPKLLQYIGAGKEIPWVQLHKAPRHVYFSHKRHVTMAKQDCPVCHGEVKGMEKPFTKAYFPLRQQGMDRCIECHRKEKVTTDCLSCHR